VLEISRISDLPEDFPEVAIALGKFDGLHLGHQQLLHELIEYAEEAGLVPAVVTFDKNPITVLQPGLEVKPLIGNLQKAKLLSDLGIELVLTLEFNTDLAECSAEEFAKRYFAGLGAKMIFLGEGAKFGFQGKGNAELLRELGPQLGFRVREVSGVLFAGEKISTTRIRNLLDQGEVEQVATLLGRNHITTGLVEHGRKLGRTIGFPTANLSRDSEGYLPADGIYAGWLYADGERYLAAHSVGTNDSVGEVPRLVESHVIGRDDLDLYDKVVTVEYVRRVRPWAKFASLEELVIQIAKDVEAAKELMSGE
jgi:riboflavin kinase/FMN adenylyltransferase